jgi:hypothetical protein
MGVTSDGDGCWALAPFHTIQISDVSGVLFGAFGITAPCGVSLSGLSQEFLHDGHGVFLLVSHVSNEARRDVLSHCLESSLCTLVGSLTLICLILGILTAVQSAVVRLCTCSSENTISCGGWSILEWILTVEALEEFSAVALASWFSPIDEVVNQFTTISSNRNLVGCDGVSHLFGGVVEVPNNFLDILGLGFRFEPL